MRAKEIRTLAWNQLKKSYWMVFVAVIIVDVLLGIASATVVGAIIVAGPLTVGLSIYLLYVIRSESEGNKLELLFDSFRKSFVTSFAAILLVQIFTFLWSLLFVIPGIIKSYAYSMTSFIIAEDPEIGATKAIDQSRALMNGNKWRLFCLDLSFIGWYLLGFLAFGVGTLFVRPYHFLARANFYDQLKKENAGATEVLE